MGHRLRALFKMEPAFITDLANQSAAVILTVLGLYLFKVVVNDMKHDVEKARSIMEDIQKSIARIADILERQERRSGENGR